MEGDQFEGIQRLRRYDTNWSGQDGPGPFSVFLDLIGWSEEHLGENMVREYSMLGYLEMGMLADALREYADRGSEAESYVGRLMEAEE